MAGRGFAMPGLANPGGKPATPARPASGNPGPAGSAPAGAAPRAVLPTPGAGGGAGAGPAPGFGMFQAKAGDTHVQASTELFNAAFSNDLAGVKKGLDDGGDVNTQDLKGVTPLLLAVHNGNVEMVKLLISKKANVNATSTNSSPLHEAVRQHNQAILDIVIAAGGNVNLTTDFGKTPLHTAIQEEQEALIDFLLAKKADVKAKNDGQVGCVHFAAATTNHKVLEKILKIKELNMNERNGNGKTALHVAAEKNNIDHIKLLLSQGADSKIKDGWGRLAEECGKTTAYHLIKDHKAGTKYEIVDPNAPESKKPEKLFDTGDFQI